MTLKQIASLGKELARFLSCCSLDVSGVAQVSRCCRFMSRACSRMCRCAQKHRGHCPGNGHYATYSTTRFRGIDQVGRRGRMRRLPAVGCPVNTLIARPSVASTNRGRPRVAGIPRALRGSGWEVVARVENGVVGVHLELQQPWLSVPARQHGLLAEGLGRRSGASKKTTFPTKCSFAPNRKSAWSWIGPRLGQRESARQGLGL